MLFISYLNSLKNLLTVTLLAVLAALLDGDNTFPFGLYPKAKII